MSIPQDEMYDEKSGAVAQPRKYCCIREKAQASWLDVAIVLLINQDEMALAKEDGK